MGNTVAQAAAQGYSSGMNDVAHSFSAADHGKQSISHLCGARLFVVMFDGQDLLEPLKVPWLSPRPELADRLAVSLTPNVGLGVSHNM